MATQFHGTTEEISALDVYIKLMRTTETVNRRINHPLKAQMLTASQFGVLEALYHLGPMNTGELGEKILRSSGNMTMVIDNLEKHGWVMREPDSDDRRCKVITLTDSGRQLIDRIFPAHVATVVETMGALTSEEQSSLNVLLRKLGRSQP